MNTSDEELIASHKNGDKNSHRELVRRTLNRYIIYT